MNLDLDDKRVMEIPTSFVDVVLSQEQQHSDAIVYTFTGEDGRTTREISYKNLADRARAIAAHLLAEGLHGKTAILLFKPGPEYVEAFFGCLFAGVVAVPAYLPSNKRTLPRFTSIVDDSRSDIILTSHQDWKLVSRVIDQSETAKSMRHINVETIETLGAEKLVMPDVNSQAPAMLQYTSGSTGTPKGVMLSHKNLLHNSQLIAEAFSCTESSRGVIWLPPYHDMGLIGGILQPMYSGIYCCLMPPSAFIRSPYRWLKAVTDHKATISGGPDFAFAHCCEKITDKQLENLCLDSWEVAFTGSEPVREEVIEKFSERFAACGFKREAFYPCYGLAESTVFISGGVTTEGPVIREFNSDALSLNHVIPAPGESNTKRLVSSGNFYSDCDWRIVDPESEKQCDHDKIGELWIASDSVSAGYWQDQQLTNKIFKAHLADTGDGPYLRTGDLAFVHENEVYIAGRLKDLIIVRGRNHYPQDIEHTASQSYPGLVKDGCTAFSMEFGGEEQLVIVQELQRGYLDKVEEAAAGIRTRVAQLHEIRVRMVILTKTRCIPRTSSGKIRRNQCRKEVSSGRIEVLYKDGLLNKTETVNYNETIDTLTTDVLSAVNDREKDVALRAYLRGLVAAKLKIDPATTDSKSPLLSYGLDSLTILEIIERVEKDIGFQLSTEEIACNPNIDQLVAQIQSNSHSDVPVTYDTGLCVAIESDDVLQYQPFPQTDIQKAYWFGRQENIYLGGNACHAYFEIDTLQLNLKSFEAALNKIIIRHEMLRAVMTSDGNQRILPTVPYYSIRYLDLSLADQQLMQEGLNDVRANLAHQVLASDKWPLFEIRASQLPDKKVRLHFSFDMLIADATSLHIFMHELYQLYKDPLSYLIPITTSFHHYVMASNAFSDTKAYKTSLHYWRAKLGNLPLHPQLSLQNDPTTIRKPRFLRRTAIVKSHAWQQLRDKAALSGLTASSILLAAFCEVLSAWALSRRFTLNITAFNRVPLVEGVENLIGDFTSLVLLEVDFSSQHSFLQRAQALQNSLWQDLVHRRVNGVTLIREYSRIHGAGTPMIAPIVFTSMLNESNSRVHSGTDEAFGDISYGISQTPQVWLDHQVREERGNVILTWDFVDELFPEGLIDDMFEAYQHLLENLTTDDDIWDLSRPQVVPQHQIALQEKINRTAVQKSDELLHGLFIKQFNLNPEKTALVSSKTKLSYSELYTCSTFVAFQLENAGVNLDEPIAVIMEKSVEQVIAVLAILMVGGAYLPIDVSLPQKRIHFLLKNGSVKIALVRPDLSDIGSLPSWIKRIDVRSNVVSEFNYTPRTDYPVSQVAYVMYTSGSTGEPKGVVIEHQGAVNTIVDINRRFNIGSNDRLLAISGLSFDLSVYDIFGMLAIGGCVVIPDAYKIKSPEHWCELIEKNNITVWNSVPALMEMLVEYAGPKESECLHALRLVMLSGDRISMTLPNRVRALTNNASVISLGGATEASIWSNFHETRSSYGNLKSIPYGTPLSNQQLYVMDSDLSPRPTLVPGQIVIAGTGLARGYWQDKDKTKNRFILHPKTGIRMYQTGDLGRYLRDGDIEFLGREDFQVKIRGHRVELGEIEAALISHTMVRSVIVLDAGAQTEHKTLSAFVVLSDVAYESHSTEVGEDTQVQVYAVAKELKKHLKDLLPEYMVPTRINVLQTMPLSSQGKIDRRALLTMSTELDVTSDEYAAPGSELEIRIAKIWKTALNIKNVGLHDNFFDIGGDSLYLTAVANQINRELNLELSLLDLFNLPTVSLLASHVKAMSDGRPISIDRDDRAAVRRDATARRRSTKKKLDQITE